jgi:hypothetical protein
MTFSDLAKWESADAERERYILYMLGNDEAARVFWEEWLPEEIERRKSNDRDYREVE